MLPLCQFIENPEQIDAAKAISPTIQTGITNF